MHIFLMSWLQQWMYVLVCTATLIRTCLHIWYCSHLWYTWPLCSRQVIPFFSISSFLSPFHSACPLPFQIIRLNLVHHLHHLRLDDVLPAQSAHVAKYEVAIYELMVYWLFLGLLEMVLADSIINNGTTNDSVLEILHHWLSSSIATHLLVLNPITRTALQNVHYASFNGPCSSMPFLRCLPCLPISLSHLTLSLTHAWTCCLSPSHPMASQVLPPHQGCHQCYPTGSRMGHIAQSVNEIRSHLWIPSKWHLISKCKWKIQERPMWQWQWHLCHQHYPLNGILWALKMKVIAKTAFDYQGWAAVIYCVLQ